MEKNKKGLLFFCNISSFISRFLGYIIMATTSIYYFSYVIQKNAVEVINICLSAIGLVAILSALCFTMVQCLTNQELKKPLMYAGEKYFHSTILLIQTIFIKFAGEYFVTLEFIKNNDVLHNILKSILLFILTILGGLAVWFSMYAFDALNDFFWKRYEERLKINNKNKEE